MLENDNVLDRPSRYALGSSSLSEDFTVNKIKASEVTKLAKRRFGGIALEYTELTDGRIVTVNPQVGWVEVPRDSRAVQFALGGK